MHGSVDKKYNLKNLEESIKLVKDLDYFIFFGTLLGYRRERDILVGDDDIDIYVDIKHRSLMQERFLSQTYFNISIGSDPTFVQLKKNYSNVTTYADFYFYETFQDKDYIFESWTSRQPGVLGVTKINIPNKLVFPIKTVNDLQGLEVKVPADIDGCCQFIYGDTYMTPLKKENIGHGTRRVNYNMFESLFTDE